MIWRLEGNAAEARVILADRRALQSRLDETLQLLEAAEEDSEDEVIQFLKTGEPNTFAPHTVRTSQKRKRSPSPSPSVSELPSERSLHSDSIQRSLKPDLHLLDILNEC